MNPDFLQQLSSVLKYSMDTVQNMLDQLASPEHSATRWGGPEADHTFRGGLADAIQESDRPHAEVEAGLLRDPKQHVVVHDGRVRAGRFTANEYDVELRRFSEFMMHRLPFGYAHYWQPVWSHSNPHLFGLDDVNSNADYRYVHHPASFGHHVANHLIHDVDIAHSDEELDDVEAGRAKALLDRVRSAPYETVDWGHPTERAAL